MRKRLRVRNLRDGGLLNDERSRNREKEYDAGFSVNFVCRITQRAENCGLIKNEIQLIFHCFLRPKIRVIFNLTSQFNEVQNLRQPTNFEFGWKGNFAWQNSEAVPCNR